MVDGNAPRRWQSLVILTCVYVVGKLSHFIAAIVIKPISPDIPYRKIGCLGNGYGFEFLENKTMNCFEANNSLSCVELGQHLRSHDSACFWDDSGLGLYYQTLTGPAFVSVFTISGIIIAMISDRQNRCFIVTVYLFLLTSYMTLIGAFGAANLYLQRVYWRMPIWAGEASFTPACSSMIFDMFPQERHGLALGIYNWGNYFGFGLSYAVGNFIMQADLAGMGWRFSYLITGLMSVMVMILLCSVVRDPPRKESEIHETEDKGKFHKLIYGKSGLKKVGRMIGKPSVMILMIAASVRHAAGFTWAYSTQLYFSTYYPNYNLGIWVAVISIVAGTLGVTSGGFVSDRLDKKLGLKARLYVLAASQFIAAPFAAGVLCLAPPDAFYALLGSTIFGEMWLGVLFAVLLEIVDPGIHSTTLAIFLFIMNNIGGNPLIFIELLRKSLSLRSTLFILYPGFYLLSSLLFLATSFLIDKKPKIILSDTRTTFSTIEENSC